MKFSAIGLMSRNVLSVAFKVKSPHSTLSDFRQEP